MTSVLTEEDRRFHSLASHWASGMQIQVPGTFSSRYIIAERTHIFSYIDGVSVLWLVTFTYLHSFPDNSVVDLNNLGSMRIACVSASDRRAQKTIRSQRIRWMKLMERQRKTWGPAVFDILPILAPAVPASRPHSGRRY